MRRSLSMLERHADELGGHQSRDSESASYELLSFLQLSVFQLHVPFTFSYFLHLFLSLAWSSSLNVAGFAERKPEFLSPYLLPGRSAVSNEGTQLGVPERPLCCRAGEEMTASDELHGKQQMLLILLNGEQMWASH